MLNYWILSLAAKCGGGFFFSYSRFLQPLIVSSVFPGEKSSPKLDRRRPSFTLISVSAKSDVIVSADVADLEKPEDC